jgi:lipopolysaccharide heptosyltransferase II
MTATIWATARNILCIRLDNLGDVLMCTPAIRALKQSVPGRKITILASEGSCAAARFIPEIDEVVGYAAPWMKSSAQKNIAADMAMIDTLRSRSFDAAVIFTSYSQSPLPAAMLCYLAGIPLRIAHCHENPYHLLTDWIGDPEPQETIRHEVQRQLDLVAAVGCHTTDDRLSFAIPAADLAWAKQQLSALGIDTQKPWVLCHPGATAASRRYPPQHWSDIANQLAKNMSWSVIFTGDTTEIQLVEQIRQNANVQTHSLAGKMNLSRFAALLSLAPAIITNNSGPAHLAAAVGTPIIDLYALTNPQHTPWQVPSRVLYHDVPCRICYKSVCPQGHNHCLTKITPEQIVQETSDLLSNLLHQKNWKYAKAPIRFTSQPITPRMQTMAHSSATVVSIQSVDSRNVSALVSTSTQLQKRKAKKHPQ